MSLGSRASAVALSTLVSACGLFSGSEEHGSKKQAVTLEPGVHLVPGNPTCEDLGLGTFELKVNPPFNGTYDLGHGEWIEVTTTDGIHFDWSSSIGIDAVLSKGGPNANAYVYDPEATSGTNLFSPDNGGGNVPAISHIDFCYDWEVRVTKTATPSFERKYTWSIDKNAEKTSLTLATGETYMMEYTVDVAASSVDSAHAISGTIKVKNPAPVAATITGVSDTFDGAPIGVTCPVSFPYELAHGAELECTYSKALGGAIDGINTATATTTGPVGGGTGTAPVAFGAPTATTDECVDVDDDRFGVLGNVCASSSPFSKKFTYELSIGPYASCGPASFVNTASFTTNDTGATGSDSVTVSSDVTCEPNSCTLTQGYWKTHSAYGPAPYDATWALIEPSQESSPFFLSGTTYFGCYAMRPRDGAYWQLAHQYVAAKLNVLNGASLGATQAAFDAATSLFSSYTPAQVGKKGALANQAKQLAGQLDAFNNGAVGPGHCDE